MYSNELYHHGIKGQKWGVWNAETTARYNGGKELIRKRYNEALTKAKIANLDKWGKDKDHNVCYLTGYSGSGKTTVSIGLKDENTNVIGLDGYFEKMQKASERTLQSDRFNDYLDKHLPNWRKIKEDKPVKDMSSDERKKHWALVDDFAEAIDSFGKEEFKFGRKVLVEGVQILDYTMRPDKKYFADKPLIILSTSAQESSERADRRDGITNKNDMLERFRMQEFWSKKIDDLAVITQAEQGRDFIDHYLKK